jgi:hypothetical protein
MTTIDLATMDDTQLAMLAAVSPELAIAVRGERHSRAAFSDMATGLTALSAAVLSHEHALALHKKGLAHEITTKSGLVDIAYRLLATAEKAGLKFDPAVLT